ncbi:MAG: FtsX-like permease family protein [Bacteroidales bacterium]|nr:FtsX-like permease family protein [Bacteroidales bacterium]
MKTALKLAYRNLTGAGLRTWLNVIVLSFSFVVILFMKGVMSGWDLQAKTDMTQWEIAGGQYWHQQYDPFDPFTLSDSHAPIPPQLADEIAAGDMVPVLMTQGSIYPQGRLQSVLIKGIPANQSLLKQPTHRLDTVTDVNGTFDAHDILIVDIFSSNVPSAEAGQIYLPLETLQKMLSLPNEATILTFREEAQERPSVEGFTLKTKEALTASIDEMLKTKEVGQGILYFVLLLLAMLAIFDTQVLSIFKRQKEIGTYIALGYTRGQVVGLFTVEGAMHSVLAAIVGALYGAPLLWWMAKNGWAMPIDTSEFGVPIAQTLYPVFSLGLIVSTTLLVVLITTIVSYWPSRKIAKTNPTEALRGKIQ